MTGRQSWPSYVIDTSYVTESEVTPSCYEPTLCEGHNKDDFVTKANQDQ